MKTVLKLLQWIYSVYALFVFIALMLVVIPFVIVAPLLGKIRSGNFIYQVCGIWGFGWYFLVGMRHRTIFETPHDTTQQYIFVANHTSYMDIPPIVMALRQPVRVLAKYEISKVPLFGIVYKRITVLVDRRDAEKRAKSIKDMKDFLQKHVSIFIFPEGTFNETGAPLKDFYDGAFRIAIETETAIKPVLFIDSIDRLHYRSLLSLTPGKCRVVFLHEIPVAGLTLADLPALKQQVHTQMEAGLRRYKTYAPLETNP